MAFLAAAILAGNLALGAVNTGNGFAPTLRLLVPPTQAATGGIGLEDSLHEGSILDAGTVLVTPGARWVSIGAEGDASSSLRIAAEGYGFAASGIPLTSENPDGTYGGEAGAANVSQTGGRMLFRGSLGRTGAWSVSGQARFSGIIQRLAGGPQATGVSAETGLLLRSPTESGDQLVLWGWAGPFGRAASHWYAAEFTAGFGYVVPCQQGLIAATEGLALTAQASALFEGVMTGAVGGVYWFGSPADRGMTFLLRAGFKHNAESVQANQWTAGVGIIWKSSSDLTYEFDYALVPFGDLGMIHYAAISLRLAPMPERYQE